MKAEETEGPVLCSESSKEDLMPKDSVDSEMRYKHAAHSDFLSYVLITVPQAAAVSSLVTKSVLHPIDTVKCRMQATTRLPSTSLWSSCMQQYRGHWSVTNLCAGLPVKLMLTVPYQSLYMSVYTYLKIHLQRIIPAADSFSTRTIIALQCAIVAECCGAVVRVPMEAMKISLQAGACRSSLEAFCEFFIKNARRTARLFFAQTLCNDVPYSCIQWIAYENLRTLFLRRVLAAQRRDEEEMNSNRSSPEGDLWTRFATGSLCGGASGMIAAGITLPLENIRTRTVLHSVHTGTVMRMRDMFTHLALEDGWRIFYRGGFMRMLWITSNMSLYFAIFEVMKAELTSRL